MRRIVWMTLLLMMAATARPVLYLPAAEDCVPLSPEEAAAAFLVGLGEEDAVLNRASLLGMVRPTVPPPQGLADLVTYGAQSEADDLLLLRREATAEGTCIFALRWRNNEPQGVCRPADAPGAEDWEKLGRMLAAGSPPEAPVGIGSGTEALDWLAENLDPGLALAAALDRLADAPDDTAPALAVSRYTPPVLAKLAPVGDAPAVIFVLDAVESLLNLAGRAAGPPAEDPAGADAAAALFQLAHAHEVAWYLLRLAAPAPWIGDTRSTVEHCIERLREEGVAYWRRAVQLYQFAAEAARSDDASVTMYLLAQTSLRRLYIEGAIFNDP